MLQYLHDNVIPIYILLALYDTTRALHSHPIVQPLNNNYSVLQIFSKKIEALNHIYLKVNILTEEVDHVYVDAVYYHTSPTRYNTVIRTE